MFVKVPLPDASLMSSGLGGPRESSGRPALRPGLLLGEVGAGAPARPSAGTERLPTQGSQGVPRAGPWEGAATLRPEQEALLTSGRMACAGCGQQDQACRLRGTVERKEGALFSCRWGAPQARAESRPQPESGLPAFQTEHFPKDVKQPRRPLGQGEAATPAARRPAARGHSGSITALGPGGSSAGDPPRTCAGNQSWAPRARQPPLLAAGVGEAVPCRVCFLNPEKEHPCSLEAFVNW